MWRSADGSRMCLLARRMKRLSGDRWKLAASSPSAFATSTLGSTLAWSG